jgi:CRP/FNR family cyclic AMP-dependent transcriptional regulator
MPIASGLNILDHWIARPIREEHLFGNLSLPALQNLQAITSTAIYPKSAILFLAGQQPRGVFVLRGGKAKLSNALKNKSINSRTSEAGDVLGLSATIANRPYEVTAEMVEPGQANFIARRPLLQFLSEHGQVALRVAEQLCHNYYTMYEEIALQRSPAEKFARLLLEWSEKTEQIKMTINRQEIAAILGTTPATVTRLFSEFKKKRILQLKGTALTICNRPALQKIVQT